MCAKMSGEPNSTDSFFAGSMGIVIKHTIWYVVVQKKIIPKYQDTYF